MNHEDYVQSVHGQIVKTAMAMQSGEMSYLLGARKLDALRHEASVKNDDEDFMVFVAIASDTDDFPLGTVREYWDKDALAKLQPEIDAAETWAREHSEHICAKLIRRFS
ncbi:hypothetical protein GCM10011396_25580 [Undibacterium terreum]|uniref:DUF2489 domain-containing protein n=2 Tax=Undibacterium terreum TaxID=1224302 RepID=A0A916UKZ0_9BURK|nr:hypothetical protein GCM10011396_25580 [Undibacterium terreum]